MIKHRMKFNEVPLEVYLSHQQYGHTVYLNSVMKMFRGSITHGTYIENNLDDVDVMDVVIPSIYYYLGLETFGSRETVEIKKDEWDIVAYEMKKFIMLLEKSNPNVIGMLWLEPEFYIELKDAGKILLESRNLFSSKLIFKPFLGYAHAQFTKMQRIKSGLGYAGEKRKNLIKQFGYDTKNASHLIRLLRTAKEFLDTGHMQVYRPDRKELLDIKLGGWTFEQIVNEKDKLLKELEESLINSKLPDKPNHTEISNLCTSIILRTIM